MPVESASGEGWELHLGRWQTALQGTTCDALVFDAPYSAKTHEASRKLGNAREDGCALDGLGPDYEAFTPELIREFCESWGPRTSGWIVSITDHVLAPAWLAEMERIGRYSFQPIPCVIRGMSARLCGDGPSSWAIYACVSRPRTKEMALWGTLDGAYTGGSGTNGRAGGSSRGGGRGKPDWLMHALVRDYSRPGDVVCDPFAGWGSTLTAAVALGRQAIGSEIDAAAFAEARRRLARPLQVDLLAGLEAR